jgi:hypothetical protein
MDGSDAREARAFTDILVVESLRAVQEILRSPGRMGPDILPNGTIQLKSKQRRFESIPRITKKFTTFIGAKNEVNILARVESLIQDPLIVCLSGPYAAIDAKIQVCLNTICQSKLKEGEKKYLVQRFQNEVPLWEVTG